MLPLIFIIIILYYTFYSFVRRQINTEPFAADMPLLSLQNIYNKHKKEYKNINNVLKRPLAKGDETANNIKTQNDFKITGNNYNMFLTVNKEEEINNKMNEKLRQIKAHPKLKNKPLKIIYGEYFYYDNDYPKEPISVEYALNPEEYIKNNPECYPSYIITKSRNEHSCLAQK
jgi:hypothetical protein